jgi:hypothetical protein
VLANKDKEGKMAEKVTLKLSAAAAAYIRQDTPKETKLQAARGDVAVSTGDLGALLFFLGHDPDPEVRAAAIKSLRDLPESRLLAIAGSANTHPKILDMLAQLHYHKQAVAMMLAAHPEIESRTLAFLATKQEEGIRKPPQESEPEATVAEEEAVSGMDEREEVDEESEEFKSKYQLSMKMGISDKIKVALIGDKEWRTLMLKDSNSLVSESALKNPRITEPEILSIVKSTALSEEMLRIICRNKEWVKNYQIRKALVLNCKTPLQSALRFLTTLTDKDMAILAKSKNISTIIATQARKLILNKKR